MSANSSKVLYFIAGATPSAAELAAIARLETMYRNVQVRRGDSATDAAYGSTAKESFDFLAGTNIPTAYSTGNSAKVITVPSAAAPDQFKLFPATLAVDASDVDVKNLAAVKANVNPATGLAEMTDLAANGMVTFASSDATKATVSSVGLVTAVAAGSTTVTATYQPGTSITGGAVEADDDIYTKTNHGFNTGDQVRLVSLTGGTGLTAAVDYFFRKIDKDTGYLCATRADAIAPVAVPVAVTLDATSVVLALTSGLQVTGGAVEADDDIYTKAAHGFDTGDALKLVSLTNGTGYTAGNTYYFRKLGVDTGYLCSTLADAVANPPVPVACTLDGTAVVLQRAPVTSTCVVTVAA